MFYDDGYGMRVLYAGQVANIMRITNVDAVFLLNGLARKRKKAKKRKACVEDERDVQLVTLHPHTQSYYIG